MKKNERLELIMAILLSGSKIPDFVGVEETDKARNDILEHALDMAIRIIEVASLNAWKSKDES